MPPVVVDAFHATALLTRKNVFDDERLTPITALQDAETAAPGWVGRAWQPGGTLLVAINPGGGGDNYRVNPTDHRLYSLIRKFRAAEGDDRENALRQMSDVWIDIQSTHNTRRVTDAVLNATRTKIEASAFLNVLPFRTRGDKPARKGELLRSWIQSTGPQVAALAPRRIIALGCKAHDALLAVGADREYEVVLIKRAIGDSTIPPHAREALARLRNSL